jgi:Fe-S-cluster containining protein
MLDKFECKRCGKCCLQVYGIDFEKGDLERFEKAGRYDLLTSDMFWEMDEFSKGKCPFLQKRKGLYSCKIQDIKPKMCRNFPEEKQHAIDYCGCPGVNKCKNIKLKPKKPVSHMNTFVVARKFFEKRKCANT